MEGLKGTTSRSRDDLGGILAVKIIRRKGWRGPIASIAVPWSDLELKDRRMDDFGGHKEGAITLQWRKDEAAV